MIMTTQEELDQSGLQDAFTSPKYGNLDGIGNNGELMLECKGKGNESFANGKRHKARNAQVIVIVGPLLFPDNVLLHTKGLNMICECFIDVLFKYIYMILIIDVYNSIFDPSGHAKRRLEELQEVRIHPCVLVRSFVPLYSPLPSSVLDRLISSSTQNSGL